MMGKKTWWRAREGQALAIVALTLPLMIGMAGVGVTVGTVYYSQAQLQSAVDAAALAGAQALSAGDPGAPTSQQSLVTANDPSAVDVSVSTSPTNPSEVVATATDNAPGTFAALFGHRTFTITAHAAALASPGQAFNYAVFQGDPNASDPPLLLNGNPSILSANGSPTADVHSNNQLKLNGNVRVDGSCSGNPTVTLIGNSSCAGGIVQPAPQIAMPQWTPSQVSPANATTVGSASNPVGMTVNGNSTATGNYIVYGNLIIAGNSTVTGHYLVEDGNIIFNGNATVNGSLVTFGGGILVNGNYTISQDGSGPLVMAAFTSNGQVSSSAANPGPDNPPNPGSIELNGNVTVGGVLYAPDSYIDGNGNLNLNGAVVGYQVHISGNLTLVQPTNVPTFIPVQQVTLVQ